MFIDRIQIIVQENFSNEKFGANELAEALGLSTSQTLRKVKAATGKSVNQYIREYRLEEAAKLIKTTDESIAEISYKVGFGSPSYFNKAFSKYFKVPPGEYKAQPNPKIEVETETVEDIVALEPKSKGFKKPIIITIAFLLICVIGYVVINNSNSKDPSLTNSIAVLPFKDLSPEDTQWFCDGVSDNILHSLAQMKDLSVTSFTSSSTFRDSDKQIPEIAKALGVSYVLEGSVVLYDSKVKVIAQLIDANDQHVWSKEYNDSFDNVIAIQQNVAQEVMKQLQLTLTSEEENSLEKYPTKNMEAYNFHIKGRLVNGSRAKQDLELNIEMNQRAIALDSSFTEAYAQIAKSYFLLSHHHFEAINVFQYREASEYFMNKALERDDKNPLAWTIKGLLLFYIDWDQAEKNLDIAIQLNPNNAFFRVAKASYYRNCVNADLKQSLASLKIAYKLDPLSESSASNLLYSLILNNNKKEAAAHYQNIKFLLQKESFYFFESCLMAYKNKDWTSVLEQSKLRVEEHNDNAIFHSRLASEYDGIMNDDANALKFAKRAYELDSTYSGLYLDLLMKNEKYNAANTIMSSDIYISNVNKKERLNQLWYYYYVQKKHKSALNVLKDSLYTDQYYRYTYTYAQMGNRKKVDSMNKRHPWGTGRHTDMRRHRVTINALLRDKDSMYYYLDRMENYEVLNLNRLKDVNPYRNDDRFKAVLRKNYLPVPKD